MKFKILVTLLSFGAAYTSAAYAMESEIEAQEKPTIVPVKSLDQITQERKAIDNLAEKHNAAMKKLHEHARDIWVNNPITAEDQQDFTKHCEAANVEIENHTQETMRMFGQNQTSTSAAYAMESEIEVQEKPTIAPVKSLDQITQERKAIDRVNKQNIDDALEVLKKYQEIFTNSLVTGHISDEDKQEYTNLIKTKGAEREKRFQETMRMLEQNQ